MDNVPIKDSHDMFQILISLIPVIAGGFVAIIGALSGSLLTYFLNLKSKQIEIKREKLEKLVIAANRTEKWLDDYKNTKFLQNNLDLGLNPIEEVRYLSALYFRQLNSEVVKLSKASNKYISLIAECHVDQLKTGSIPNTFLEKFGTVYGDVVEANSNLLKKASEIATNM